jgi:hypothetical protein
MDLRFLRQKTWSWPEMRGGLDPYVGKLWDAASRGPFESVSTVGLRIWDFRVEDLAGAKGEREC